MNQQVQNIQRMYVTSILFVHDSEHDNNNINFILSTKISQ